MAVVALCGLLAGCESLQGILGSAQKPSVRVAGVRLEGLSLTSVKLVFDTEVTNPYSVPLPLANLEYALASGGKAFLAGKAPVQGSIPAGGSKVVPLPAEVSFAPMLGALEGVRPGALVPYDAELKLSVDAPAVGELVLPIRHSGQIPVPTVPSVELGQIEWKALSLESAAAVIHLTVANGNQFPVDLTKIAFALSLGGTDVGKAGVGEPTRLDAGGKTTLQIPLSLSPVKLGFGALEILRGEGAGYKLDGSMALATAFGSMELPLLSTGKTKFKK